MNVGYVEGFVPYEEWRKTVSDFNGLCAYCQERTFEERDHFIPQTKGGITEIGNLLPACGPCNKRKSNSIGRTLIGTFGQEKINTLTAYLASRSEEIISSPVEPIKLKGMSVSLAIQKIALDQGLDQETLADLSGVTPQLIGRYWNNRIQRVDLPILARIAEALKVPFCDLFEVK